MAIEEVESNGTDYADSIPSSEKKVVLRKNTADDPLTWDQQDNNFEILRAKINELVAKVNELDNA
tara:strand:+ start:717 stop:911 length:195 start_codon:yes stop_codon:yes gene_type:complete